MEHFVTLFDSLFLPQGLALHRSMKRHMSESFTLWVLCIDNAVYENLQRLSLPEIRLLQLDQLETEDLKRVKGDRTRGEYCWTLTPFAPKFVFEADSSVSRVTYLDADLWFRKNPASIFDEFERSKKHVLITDHAYAPEYDSSSTSGQYCVQFMTFRRDSSEQVRSWWEDRCIEWCYNRIEDGKFGDQKYLDDWPQRFPEHIHVLENKELALAPWNATRFPYSTGIFWHFHGLRISKRRSKLMIHFGKFPIPKPAQMNIYAPYLSELRQIIELLKQHNIHILAQEKFSTLRRVKGLLGGLYLQLWRIQTEKVEPL